MRRILHTLNLIIGLCYLNSAWGTLLINGDFASGLGGWQTAGEVFSGVEEAALTDGLSARTLLYQGVELDAGTYTVTVEFREVLSAQEPVGYAKDTFFASLYFTGTPEQFDPRDPSGFDVAVPLFDVDSSGVVLFTGSIEEDLAVLGYDRFYGNFALESATTVFAVFELTNLNGILDNSVVLVDTVVITVPEPALAALVAGLATWLLLIRKRLNG